MATPLNNTPFNGAFYWALSVAWARTVLEGCEKQEDGPLTNQAGGQMSITTGALDKERGRHAQASPYAATCLPQVHGSYS